MRNFNEDEYMHEMHQLVMQECDWIIEDYEIQRLQELHLEEDLLKIQIAEITVKMVLIYIKMLQEGESQNIVAEARKTVASALDDCERCEAIDSDRIQAYRNMLS